MNPLDLFLNCVERELRSMPKWKKEEELRELRSHLEQRVEDFEREGLKWEDAQTRAVEMFGSPKALGAQLGDAWEGVPTSWGGVAAVMSRVLAIALAAQLAISLLCLAPNAWPGDRAIGWSPFAEVLYSVCGLLSPCVPVCCGGLLSLWIGRRGPKMVLSIVALLLVVNAPMLAKTVVDTKMLLLPRSELMFFLLEIFLGELLLWLLGAILFRFVLQRRWRNLPLGEKPNAKGNLGSFVRFKPRKR